MDSEASVDLQASTIKDKQTLNSIKRKQRGGAGKSQSKDSPVSLKKIINKLEKEEKKEMQMSMIKQQQGTGALFNTNKKAQRNRAAVTSFASNRDSIDRGPSPS